MRVVVVTPCALGEVVGWSTKVNVCIVLGCLLVMKWVKFPPPLRVVPTVPAAVLCCMDLVTVFRNVTDSDV